jgi:lycopene beta-cyclase
VIAGGGLSGALAALALAERRPDVPFLLVEQGEAFGGNHIWSFFDSDVDEDDRWLIDPMVARRWPEHEVRFPRRRRTIGLGYNSVKSSGLDRVVRERLRPDQYRLGRRIVELGQTHILLDGGERIEAEGVVDARGPGPGPVSTLPGRNSSAGPIAAPPRMAASARSSWTRKWTGGRLPFRLHIAVQPDRADGRGHLLFDFARPGRAGIGNLLDAYVRAQGWPEAEVIEEETGVLPVLLGGEIAALWPASEPQVARLGLRGGFFHPTTGYSLPDAVRNALLLAEQRDFGSKALHALFRKRAAALWEERSFFQLLNRMLFRAAQPPERYRVLEHFYRLPVPLIARFYAAKLTPLDKLRIVSGKPPVPIAKR